MQKSGFTIMRKLIGLLKPLIHVITITISMGIVGFLCSIFITIFGGVGLLNIIGFSTGISNKTIFIVVAVLAIMRGVLRYAEQASGHYIAFKILAVLRDRVYVALRRLAPAKLEGKEKGNLISIITTDIELLEVFYAHTIAPIMIAILTSLIMVIFIGHYSWVLAIVALLSYGMVGFIIPMLNGKYGRETGRKYREDFGKLNSYVLESLYGLTETIQYEDGENRLDQIRKKSHGLDVYQEKLKRKEGVTKAATDAVILLCDLTILFVGIGLMKAGNIEFDGVLIPTIALMSSFGPVVALSNLSNNLLQTLASGERVLSILEEEPVLPEVVGGVDIASQQLDGMSMNGVSFDYEDQQVLSNISLDIPKQGIIGLHGRSGSGKSTLLKLMMRFWDAEEGSITLNCSDQYVSDEKMSCDGKSSVEQRAEKASLVENVCDRKTSIQEMNTANLRDLESYMTQDTFLFDDTIEENIKIGNLSATHEQVVEAAKKASIHDFIMTLPNGYDTKAGELGSSLSGGEKQRIGLARAFLHDAPMLLLDEPTSNLDSLNEAMILKVLKEECKTKSVVLVSHRASTMNIADRVYKIESGRMS